MITKQKVCTTNRKKETENEENKVREKGVANRARKRDKKK